MLHTIATSHGIVFFFSFFMMYSCVYAFPPATRAKYNSYVELLLCHKFTFP